MNNFLLFLNSENFFFGHPSLLNDVPCNLTQFCYNLFKFAGRVDDLSLLYGLQVYVATFAREIWFECQEVRLAVFFVQSL